VAAGCSALAGEAHLEVGVVFAVAFALAAGAWVTAVCIAVMAAGWWEGCFGLGWVEGRWDLAAQDGETARGVGFLHALLLGFFAGAGGFLVAPHAGDVGGVVDVP
jgi:uncharacterized membrane protein